MCFALKGKRGKRNKFFISQDVHPQTIALIETRASAIGIEIRVGNHSEADLSCSSSRHKPTRVVLLLEYLNKPSFFNFFTYCISMYAY